MIVNYNHDGWEIITQRAHGVLAAQIAMQWNDKLKPERWTETLLAIAEHDDAEIELEGDILITDTGGPVNFSMKEFDLAHARRLSNLSVTKSRYIATIISLHMDFLYKRFKKTDHAARVFLQEQKKIRHGWTKELGMTGKEFSRIYRLLEWCDALSLILCQRQIQPEHRVLEISTDAENTSYYLKQLKDEVLSVKPWPFETNEFTLIYESRFISQIKFSSTKDFVAAFKKQIPSQNKIIIKKERRVKQ